MSNWKLINKTFLYDGTFDGLLTIVFDCYSTKTLPQNIKNEQNYNTNFLDDNIFITSNYEKSERVFKGIEKNICYDALYNSYYAFLSNVKNIELDILKYLCDGFDIGPKINTMLTTSYVYNVISTKKRVYGECHRFKGLLRFIDIGNNLFYSSIHPDYKIEKLPKFVLPELSDDEKLYQELWRSFFKSVTINERTNRRCQMQFMPKKYWDDLIENP